METRGPRCSTDNEIVMPRIQHGAPVIFKAGAPKLAAVVAGPWEDGSYDLDCQQRVRPDAIMPFPEGEMVEYNSASMNAWIPARLLRQGQRIATFDLDCKDGVEISKIRLPPPHAGKGGSAPGPPATTLPIQAGDFCFYKSSAHGWIPAKVLSSRGDLYDLDVKPGANAENMFRLLDGVVVEYHSQSSNSWIPAKLLNKASEPGTFDLDCKMSVPVTKIRPPADAVGGSGPPKQSRGGAAGATAGFFGWWGGEAQAGYAEPEKGKGKDKGKDKGKGYEGGFVPNPAGGTTSDVPQQEWSMFGGWGGAPKVTFWRYCPQDGRHLDIRSEPNIDGARSLNCLGAGDVFCVIQEKQGPGGVLYLELADGRGWVFDHKPGFGNMCQRHTVEEDDGPGCYAVIHDKLEVNKARSSSGGDIVGKLAAGGTVNVIEVSRVPEQQKVRAHIEAPAGWITLLDASGIRYAVRSKRPPPRSERSACTVWGR
ncbi:unnamed protein product [Effrenium voratum]|nr:unnamed protein product [Effrenium voratum]